MDIADFIKNNWKALVMLLFAVLILVYGMTTDQAMEFVNQVINFYKGLG